MLGELFDPKAEYFVQDRLSPHWSQAGAIVFITARTRDSIPKQVLELWDREKNEWLDLHEINQVYRFGVVENGPRPLMS